jgi:hypothetical protein
MEGSGAVSDGSGTRPSAMLASVAARIPSSSAPVTLRAHSAAISSNPPAAISALGLAKLPGCSSVSLLAATQPAPSKPIRARNRPMPAPMARFWLSGMALISHSRAGLAETATNRMPDRKTQPSASRQSPASSGTTVKAK